nr:MAG TPA: hypothetical protein [Bacteriophage sp.]
MNNLTSITKKCQFLSVLIFTLYIVLIVFYNHYI